MSTPTAASGSVIPAEALEIVKEAYAYGFPMVDSYRIQYCYLVDQTDPEYKGGLNEVLTVPRTESGRCFSIQR